MTYLNRRQALGGFAVTFELLATGAFADAVVAKRKLVVVICRGGLDGLSLSPPVGDPDYAGLRGPIAIAPVGAPAGALKLDGTFGLHPALPRVHDLALQGQARIAPAIATPDRERSHFEAQDVLETGAGHVYSTSSGWLNRALEAAGPKVKALSVGPTAPLVLRGKVEAGSWSPPSATPACRASCRISMSTTGCWGRRSPRASPPKRWRAPRWPTPPRPTRRR